MHDNLPYIAADRSIRIAIRKMRKDVFPKQTDCSGFLLVFKNQYTSFRLYKPFAFFPANNILPGTGSKILFFRRNSTLSVPFILRKRGDKGDKPKAEKFRHSFPILISLLSHSQQHFTIRLTIPLTKEEALLSLSFHFHFDVATTAL